MIDWYLGFVIAFVIIEIIVILVAMVIQLAQRISREVRAVSILVGNCADNTRAVDGVRSINSDTDHIVAGLTIIRQSMA